MNTTDWFRYPLAMSLLAGICFAAADPALVRAIKTGDKATAVKMIQQKADVNARATDKSTALHWAVNLDDLELADLLIRAGADVHAANSYGIVPIALAVQNGNARMIAKLLSSGADLKYVTPAGEPLLMTAARVGNIDAVKVLLNAGADPNVNEPSQAQTALMWAIDEMHSDVARLLIDRGASILAKSRGGYTPLLFAIRSEDLKLVSTLLDKGANANDSLGRQGSALTMAITNGSYDIAALLLERGADATQRGPQGGVLHALVKRGAPGGDDDPEDTLEAAETAPKMDRMALARLLVNKGADVNLRGPSPPRGRTASIATALKALPKPANPDTSGGVTPFLSAAENADTTFMRFLLANGADPKATSAHDNALMLAAGVGNAPGTNAEADLLEAVKICFEAGIDINGIDDNGDTAMHGAVLRGTDSVIRFLAEHGAHINYRNRIGWTPLDIAEALLPGTPKYRPEHSAVVLRQLLANSSGASPSK